MEETYLAGTLAGAGSFRCTDCGYAVAFDALETVPECPNCGASSFSRASLFDFEPEHAGDGVLVPDDDSDWVLAARAGLENPGRYLAFRDRDRVSVIPLSQSSTRVGRSPSADLRLDDPTVSRRHALIVREGLDTQVFDDRSLNGVFLNGERIESGRLVDGDALVVGRYRLHFLNNAGAIAPTGSGASQALA